MGIDRAITVSRISNVDPVERAVAAQLWHAIMSRHEAITVEAVPTSARDLDLVLRCHGS
jgi:hypothetical protein